MQDLVDAFAHDNLMAPTISRLAHYLGAAHGLINIIITPKVLDAFYSR